MSEFVTIQHRQYKSIDGMREEIWCNGKKIAEHPLYYMPFRPISVDWNWLQLSTMHRTMFMPWDGSDAAYSSIDGSCLVKALVKQGPCALALYKGGVA